MQSPQKTSKILWEQFTTIKNRLCHGVDCYIENLKSPLIFVEQGVKINSDHYIDNILVSALEEMKKHFKDQSSIFQQDGAPSHISKKTHEWHSCQFPRFWSKEMWPPSSTDLNPMDFCVWLRLEAKACSVAHASVDAQKQLLQQEWAKILHDNLCASVEDFKRELKQLFKLWGNIFKSNK